MGSSDSNLFLSDRWALAILNIKKLAVENSFQQSKNQDTVRLLSLTNNLEIYILLLLPLLCYYIYISGNFQVYRVSLGWFLILLTKIFLILTDTSDLDPFMK